MPKCNGMDRSALLLRMRPCDVDKSLWEVRQIMPGCPKAYFSKEDPRYRVCCHITRVVSRMYVQVASANSRSDQWLGMREERKEKSAIKRARRARTYSHPC